jgi:hypothetical protein
MPWKSIISIEKAAALSYNNDVVRWREADGEKNILYELDLRVLRDELVVRCRLENAV